MQPSLNGPFAGVSSEQQPNSVSSQVLSDSNVSILIEQFSKFGPSAGL